MMVYTEIQSPSSPIVLALGYFDGLHRAHQKILAQTVLSAQEEGLLPAVFTFSLGKDRPAKKRKAALLLSESEKLRKMENMGIQLCYYPRFFDISQYEAQWFVEEILIHRLLVKKIICGSDHRFGKEANGDAALLQSICRRKNVDCLLMEPITQGGIPIRASTIREALLRGDIRLANQLLGYEFTIDSIVRKGKQWGRLLGAPTINQWFEPGCIVPKFGVYGSEIWVENKWHGGITNIGVRPTVEQTTVPIAETHIFDYDGNLYGKQTQVRLLRFLRPEKRFHNSEELKRQLALDIQMGRKMDKTS